MTIAQECRDPLTDGKLTKIVHVANLALMSPMQFFSRLRFVPTVVFVGDFRYSF